MKESTLVFKEAISHGNAAYSELADVYKSIIGLVNTLHKKAKHHMYLLSDVDSGLDDKIADSERNIQSSTHAITEDLSLFNEEITSSLEAFSKKSDDLVAHFEKAIQSYSGQKSELSDLLMVRKKVLYETALTSRFKSKVLVLQSIIKVIPPFTEELSNAKLAYETNLKAVLSVLVSANESNKSLVKRIEDNVQ